MSKGYVLERFEDRPGFEGETTRLSTKRLFAPATSVSIEPGHSPLERRDELRQADEPPMIFEDEHEPRWSLESRAYPDMLGFRRNCVPVANIDLQRATCSIKQTDQSDAHAAIVGLVADLRSFYSIRLENHAVGRFDRAELFSFTFSPFSFSHVAKAQACKRM